MQSISGSNEDQLDYTSVMSSGELTSHSNPMTEIVLAEDGIKEKGVRDFASLIGMDMQSIAKLLGTTERTLLRNRNQRLNRQVSENALAVARLTNFGVAYFGSIELWKEWLDSANFQFDGNKPISVMHSIRGRELIERVINGLKYGFTA